MSRTSISTFKLPGFHQARLMLDAARFYKHVLFHNKWSLSRYLFDLVIFQSPHDLLCHIFEQKNRRSRLYRWPFHHTRSTLPNHWSREWPSSLHGKWTSARGPTVGVKRWNWWHTIVARSPIHPIFYFVSHDDDLQQCNRWPPIVSVRDTTS